MNHKKNCCGCTACQQICPVQCIAMEPDEEGFLYPKINETACIHCDQCKTVCPILTPLLPAGETKTYVGYARNEEIRRQSSSGGIFSLAAQVVLKRGGVVFGAAFDDAFQVRHIGIESEKDLWRLRGSKYVQSSLDNTYPQVRQYLAAGRWVLFSGTACQIAGLKKYLGKAHDRLLTIDVLCHGVPSPKIWNLYLEEQERKHHGKITSIQFRDKRLGWKLYSIRILFADGGEYAVPFPDDVFMNMFLVNIDLRPACHDCRFKEFPRVSDMTIGDCWGIENYMPEMDDDKGTSLFMVHSPKGERILEAIREDLAVKEAELNRFLSGDADLRKSVDMHPNRKKYWAGVYRGESLDVLHGYVRKSFLQKVVGLIRWVLMR